MSKNVAVILAGGKGIRLGYSKPKQFLKVAGKLIIEHTIDAFQKHKLVDEIIIVCNKDYIYLVEDLVNRNNYNKVKKVLNGGEERKDSSLSAINSFTSEKDDINLIFHDAVRPLISAGIITECINKLNKYNSVDVAIPSTDTIIKVTEDNIISSIPSRNELRSGQTPQAFKLETIKKAYNLAVKDTNFEATDDCGIVRKYLPDEKIYVVEGGKSNIKLTHREDLYLLDKLFQVKSIENNKKSDLKELEGRVLVVFGASYGIGKDIVEIARKSKCKVYGFSRSDTNTDVSKLEDVKKALEVVFKKEGSIDFVINTAGILHKESLINMDYDTMINSIDVNYKAPVLIAKESFKYLKDSKGSLLFFTSSSYTRGRANYSLYSSSKSAMVNFTQAISEEWDTFEIKINCINPERTKTPMRIKNFGNEDDSTLLSSLDVANKTLETLLLDVSGQVIDIKVNSNE